ncbi:MAG TPA: hypothetical protein PKD72_12100 [Gemmatales bacterium]|nr:hypothetical protein [Gemmatales bacterium]
MHYVDRRRFLMSSTSTLTLALGCHADDNKITSEKMELAELTPFVKIKEKWKADEFYNFLNALSEDQRLSLM